MDLKDAIRLLHYHQRWRQGIEDDMKYTPSQLTTALDLVLEQVKKLNIDDARSSLVADIRNEMDANEFIDKQVQMLKNQFGKQQIRNNVWQYVAENGMGVIKIDTIIDRSMEVYAEIMKRFYS